MGSGCIGGCFFLSVKIQKEKTPVSLCVNLFCCHFGAMEKFYDEDLLTKMATAFRKLREEKDVSQETVYYETEINIGRVERALFNLKIGTISALCKYYEIKLSDFFKMVENEK